MLFGKRNKERAEGRPPVQATLARQALCRVCDERRTFSQCWLRLDYVKKCPCCGEEFDKPEAMYQRFHGECVICGEHLEHPQFEYGICDVCGSKHELVEGAKPSLLPNKRQRDKMNSHGKAHQ